MVVANAGVVDELVTNDLRRLERVEEEEVWGNESDIREREAAGAKCDQLEEEEEEAHYNFFLDGYLKRFGKPPPSSLSIWRKCQGFLNNFTPISMCARLLLSFFFFYLVFKLIRARCFFKFSFYQFLYFYFFPMLVRNCCLHPNTISTTTPCRPLQASLDAKYAIFQNIKFNTSKNK